MELGLKSRVAIVTGASRGIGKAVAAEFAKEGADLAICDIRKGLLEETRGELSALGVRVLAGALDVANREQVDAFVAKTAATYGRIDILVNNAVVVKADNFLEMSNEDWTEQFNITVLGMVNFCRASVPHMQKRQWGRIVNITSTHGQEPTSVFYMPYCATKAGLANLSKSLSNLLATDGILVNCVSPGLINTPIHGDPSGYGVKIAKMTGMSTEGQHDVALGRIPMVRAGEAEEIAAAVAFLASERASYITGAQLPVDGGIRRGFV